MQPPYTEPRVSCLLFLSIAVISIAVQVLAVPYRVQAGAQGSTQKPPIIRSTSRLMNVNVLVIDRQGQPVRGLTRDDFQIFDNGQPQKVAFFSSGDDKTVSRYSTRSLAAGEYSNDPHSSGLADQGATIILFDTLSTAYLSQAYSLGGIRIFLRQLQPKDRVGIYVLNENGLKVVYDPGQPASSLLEAMQRYDEAHHGGAGSKAIPPAEDSTGSVELDRFLRGREDREPLRHGEPCAITIAAFQEIARSTVGLTGRKAIIWVTENPLLSPVPQVEGNIIDHLRDSQGCGDYDPELIVEEPINLPPLPSSSRSRSVEPGDSSFGLRSGTGSMVGVVQDQRLGGNDELDLLVRLFTQNDIVLYPVSAEGLQTVRLFAGRSGGNLAAVANVRGHQVLEEIAIRTGGRTFYNRNDLETGIRRALNDAQYGYELAYYPEHDRWNADWRKIQVKVNRPGMIVLAREGYFAFPEAKLLPPKARKQLLEEIAASPLEDTEIPITVKMTPPASATASSVEARVFLSAQNLFTNHGDGWKGDFEVLLFQLTAENKILDVTTEPVSVELTEAKYTDALKQGINTQAELQLKPGAAILYVIVHDKRTDAVGSVRIPLEQYANTPH